MELGKCPNILESSLLVPQQVVGQRHPQTLGQGITP